MKMNAFGKAFFAFLLLALASPYLASCGRVSRVVGNVTGYDKMCVDGVQYLQFTSGAALQVDSAGKPVTCHGN